MDFDLKCRDLNDKLTVVLNESGLPLTIIAYILDDISRMVKTQLNDYLKQAE